MLGADLDLSGMTSGQWMVSDVTQPGRTTNAHILCSVGSQNLRLVGRMAWIWETRNAHEILSGVSLGRYLYFGRPKEGWGDDFKILRTRLWGSEVDETAAWLCLMTGFGTGGVETLIMLKQCLFLQLLLHVILRCYMKLRVACSRRHS